MLSSKARGVHLGVHNPRTVRSLPVTLGNGKGQRVRLISLPLRRRLKIPWPKGHLGSTPSPGTIDLGTRKSRDIRAAANDCPSSGPTSGTGTRPQGRFGLQSSDRALTRRRRSPSPAPTRCPTAPACPLPDQSAEPYDKCSISACLPRSTTKYPDAAIVPLACGHAESGAGGDLFSQVLVIGGSW